jgi:Transcriptional regulator SbtR-like, C-terminal domain
VRPAAGSGVSRGPTKWPGARHGAPVRRGDQPHQRLRAVLEAYAVITHESRHEHDGDIVASLHRDRHVADAERHLHEMVTRLLADAATAGEIRADMQPDELATFCLNALTAARTLPTKAAVQRLLAVTLGALDPT